MSEKMKALLKYPGAKWRISEWIVSHFPDHKVYVEPFCGSAAVFFHKLPSQKETINDLDKRIYNLFKVCREKPVALAAAVNLTPFSRNEYNSVEEKISGQQIEPSGCDVEDARRFIVRCHQSYGAKLSCRVGWKNTQVSRGPNNPAIWNALPEIVIQACERLKMAQIECRPAVEIIKKYDAEDALIYCDPPYLQETRRTKKLYSHEMNPDEHNELLHVLRSCKSKIVISGYDSEVYNEMLPEWRTDEISNNTNSGERKVEKIWMNF